MLACLFYLYLLVFLVLIVAWYSRCLLCALVPLMLACFRCLMLVLADYLLCLILLCRFLFIFVLAYAWFSCDDACLPACFPFAHARLFSLFDTRLFVVLMLASSFCVKIVWYICKT